MRITESGLRKVIKRIVAEHAAMEDPYEILANGLLNNDLKEINWGVEFLNRSLKPTDTNDMIVQRLVQYGVDEMTAHSFVDKTFPE